VRRIDLRREEAAAEIAHLKASRAFQVEVEGNYSEEEMDRYEVNGDKIKQGDLEDIRRRLTFSITHPLLGQSVEDRLLTANQELRLVELEETAAAARSEATIGLIGAYVDLGAEQRHRELRSRAIGLTERKVKILEQRTERGESLRRDVLAAKADLAGAGPMPQKAHASSGAHDRSRRDGRRRCTGVFPRDRTRLVEDDAGAWCARGCSPARRASAAARGALERLV